MLKIRCCHKFPRRRHFATKLVKKQNTKYKSPLHVSARKPSPNENKWPKPMLRMRNPLAAKDQAGVSLCPSCLYPYCIRPDCCRPSYLCPPRIPALHTRTPAFDPLFSGPPTSAKVLTQDIKHRLEPLAGGRSHRCRRHPSYVMRR